MMTDEQASVARYVDMTDDQASNARLADLGKARLWKGLLLHNASLTDTYRQALHDRDRYQRERDYWREQCIDMTGGLIS